MTERNYEKQDNTCGRVLSAAFHFFKDYNPVAWKEVIDDKRKETIYFRQMLCNYTRVAGHETKRNGWQTDKLSTVLELFDVSFSTFVIVGEALLARGVDPYNDDSKAKIQRFANVMRDSHCPAEKISQYLDFLMQRDKLQKQAQELGIKVDENGLVF